MTVNIDKIFNGFVSVRDYLVKKCVALRQDLVIIHDGKKMTVPFETIENPMRFQIHKTKFKSKFENKPSYELYDFTWRPDEEKPQENIQQKLI